MRGVALEPLLLLAELMVLRIVLLSCLLEAAWAWCCLLLGFVMLNGCGLLVLAVFACRYCYSSTRDFCCRPVPPMTTDYVLILDG